MQESFHVWGWRGRQTPYQIHVYKSRFLWQDYQTSLKFFGNTPAMVFNDNLNNTKVCSAINSLPVSCFVTRNKKVNKQNRNRTSVHSNCTRYRNTATNGRSSAKSCFSLPTFLCYSSSNNTLRNVTWYREKTNAAILSIDHVDVIAITCEQLS